MPLPPNPPVGVRATGIDPGPSTALPADPLVSVVVPAYNYAHFLGETIDSVIAQDYPRVELVVIDDGSTDSTRDVLASYGDRVRWTTQPNAGQGVTMNRAFERARGDLVGYLNADDILGPGLIAASVAALRARPDAVMMYCNYTVIDGESRASACVRLAANIDLAAILHQGFSKLGPGSLVRRAALAEVGGWDATIKRSPDFDFVLRLARIGAFVHVPHAQSAYRLHPQSITGSRPSLATVNEPVQIVRRLYDEFELPPEIVAMKAEALAMAHLTVTHGHLHAGRWWRAMAVWTRAVTLMPRLAFQLRPYRFAIGGLVGRFIHYAKAAVRPRRRHHSPQTSATAPDSGGRHAR